MDLPIGELARLAQVKVPTIRYYEQIGLMTEPPRTEGQQRRYSAADVKRLTFIRHARELGFEIDAIRQLLALVDQPDRPCEEVDAIACAHLVDIDSKIERLTAMRREVARMLEGCAVGSISECRVVEVLADHGKCENPHHGSFQLGQRIGLPS